MPIRGHILSAPHPSSPLVNGKPTFYLSFLFVLLFSFGCSLLIRTFMLLFNYFNIT